MAFTLVVLGSKVPAPPLHTAPVATVKLPFSCVAALLAHSTLLGPAFTVIGGVKVTFMLSFTALHTPLPVVVK